MKVLGYIVFGLLVMAFTAILVLGTYATVTDEDHDPPELAARKAECKKVVAHVFEIAPQSQLATVPPADRGNKLDELVASVPVEDLEQCAAEDPDKKTDVDRKPSAIACIMATRDKGALAKCIPPKQE
jgi:hypothetical protein